VACGVRDTAPIAVCVPFPIMFLVYILATNPYSHPRITDICATTLVKVDMRLRAKTEKPHEEMKLIDSQHCFRHLPTPGFQPHAPHRSETPKQKHHSHPD
jgi:hypothetical protein